MVGLTPASFQITLQNTVSLVSPVCVPGSDRGSEGRGGVAGVLSFDRVNFNVCDCPPALFLREACAPVWDAMVAVM